MHRGGWWLGLLLSVGCGTESPLTEMCGTSAPEQPACVSHGLANIDLEGRWMLTGTSHITTYDPTGTSTSTSDVFEAMTITTDGCMVTIGRDTGMLDDTQARGESYGPSGASATTVCVDKYGTVLYFADFSWSNTAHPGGTTGSGGTTGTLHR